MAAPDIQMYRPPAGHPLEPYVLSIFRVRTEAPHRVETILPKGNVDILFNLGDAMRGDAPDRDSYVVQPGAAWIGGLKTRPYSVLPNGMMYLLGVSLRAEACAGLLPLAPAEIINLEAHDPPAAGMRTMAEQLHGLPSFAEQRALLIRWLMARLRPPRGAEVVRHACDLLRQSRAEDAVRRTARSIAVSPRHLRRLLGEHVGIGPAEYVRLARFISATHEIVRPERTLTQVALACGYYDQAHFCRDFRSFSDMTPQEYRARANHPVAGHIVTP
jgi:AraC-like DNA-binding protein